jgi:hypothetical protein
VISAIIKDLKRFEKKRELARISRKYYAMGPEEKLPEEPVLVEKVRDVKGCVVESGV